MNWEAVGAIAELVGAIGVIASLIYLAMQIRQNTRSLEANTFQTISDASVGRLMTLARDDVLAERFVEGMIDPSRLEGSVRFQFDAWMRSNFKGYENYYYQYCKGMLDEESFKAQREAIRLSVTPPGVAVWWGMNRRWFREDFASLVDSLLPETGTD